MKARPWGVGISYMGPVNFCHAIFDVIKTWEGEHERLVIRKKKQKDGQDFKQQ
jgi:hypothetical protein